MFKKKKTAPIGRQPAQPDTSKRVFSYYNNRSALVSDAPRKGNKSTRFTPSLPKGTVVYIPSIIAAFVLVVAIMYSFWLSVTPRVSVVGDGTVLRKQDVYQAGFSAYLQANQTQRVKLLFDADAAAAYLQDMYPELRSVSVSVPLFGHTPVVQLESLSPDFVLNDSTGASYFISDSGRVTDKVSSYEQTPSNVVPLIDQSGLEVTPGKQIVTEAEVTFMKELYRQMKGKGITVASLTLPSKPYQLQVRVSGQNYVVIFHMLGDARLQAGSYIATARQLTEQGKVPAEYIDVRIGDKVFYK